MRIRLAVSEGSGERWGMVKGRIAVWLVVCLVVAACQLQAGLYEDGVKAYRDGNYKAALPLFRKAAEQGDAKAQGGLGDMHRRGKGVPQDYAKALKWYRKAAEKGNARAQHNLGRMYYYGQGMPQDYAEALKWFLKTAEQGVAVAQYSLGLMYYYGKGVPQDYAEALKWYLRAAEKGYAEAQFNLGFMYEKGQSVPQDYAEALKWYLKSAKKNHTGAFVNIGNMHYAGRGVKQDYTEAVKWYRRAAEKGFPLGQMKMGLVYENGRGVKKNYREAIRWYKMAAEQGDSLSQWMLGRIYGKGVGVKTDYEEAYRWYSMAAAQGDEKARGIKRIIWLLKYLTKLKNNVWLLTALQAFLFIPFLIYPIYKRISLKDFFGLIPVSKRCLWMAFGIGLAQLSITFLLDFAQDYLPHLSMERAGELIQGFITHQPISSLITIGLIGPFFEELIFRGFLQKSLYRFGVKKAILISSAVFAIFHPQNPLGVLWIGLLMGYVFWLTRSLWPAILIHSINNSAVVLLMLIELNLGWEMSDRTQLILCLAFLPVFFVLMRRFIQEVKG